MDGLGYGEYTYGPAEATSSAPSYDPGMLAAAQDVLGFSGASEMYSNMFGGQE